MDDVKSNIDWDSAAALEYLGPSALNIDQQKQIQAVLANLATVKEGTLPAPNWIRARCDDPLRRCTYNWPTATEDENKPVVLAYARNPSAAGSKYPDISFCPQVYQMRSLGNAIAYGSVFSNPKSKNNIATYENRAEVFLHELIHLDLAADSVNDSPNPKVYDIKIRYKYRDRPGDSGWVKAYGPTKAKILARFQPAGSASKQTGYFVQRNDDNLVYFALSNYVASKIGTYPYAPIIYDKIKDGPVLPPARSSVDPYIFFTADGDNAPSFDTITSESPEAVYNNSIAVSCPTVEDEPDVLQVDIGAPAPIDAYPDGYWLDREIWLNVFREIGISGFCSLSVTEAWTCEDQASNLYAAVTVTGPDGKVWYTTTRGNSIGLHIDDGQPLKVQAGGMTEELIIVGEHVNDYIQFTYGSLRWTSGTTTGDYASCTLKGDDWDKNGPPNCPNAPAESRHYDCQFFCG